MNAPDAGHNPPDASLLRTVATLYRSLWHYGQQRRTAMLGVLALLGVAELLRLALPWLAGSAMNVIQQHGAAQLPRAGQYMLGICAVVMLAWCCQAAGRVLERNIALHVREVFSLHLLNRLLRVPLWWYRREHPVTVMQRAVQGSEALHNFAESQYIYLHSFIRIVGPLVALWLMSAQVGLVATLGFGLLCVISLGFDQILLRHNDDKNAADRDNLATWSDVLGNYLTVLSLRLRHGASALARQRLLEIFKPLRRIMLLNEFKWGAVDVFSTLLWCALVVIYVLASASSAQATVALGSVFMVYDYARRIERALGELTVDFSMLAGQLSGFRAAQPLTDAPIEAAADAALQPTAWQRLELQDVSLRYAPHVQVLDQVSLQLKRQRRYALVGASGAGKTSLLMLLAGLEPPSSGKVARDGVFIDAVQLRHEVTLVPSQFAVFAGNAHDNVALAATHADSTQAAVLSALSLAGLHGHGPATPLAETPTRWSRGQQQRLALARGLLAAADSSLLLFDEPVSHLDAHGAQHVVARILRQHRAACVVMSVHNLELLGQFDEVIVMDAGRIVDAGSINEVRLRCHVLQRLLASFAPVQPLPEKSLTAVS